VIVLRREDDPRYVKVVPEWWAVEGAATVFPPSCTGATPQALRDLLCPDPWSVLGYPRPRIQPQAAYAIRIRSTDLHALDWENVTLPGAACGSTHPIPLRESQALVRSTIWPWWPLVDVSAYPRPTFGDLDGDERDEAALNVMCSNGGGMAAGQLGSAYVIFSARRHVLRVVGVVRPRQPLDPEASHVPLLGAVEILPGKVIVQEAWYGPHDGTCCSSGRAATVWTYATGTLRPTRTVVVLPPSR
jgi:hypothetical protein